MIKPSTLVELFALIVAALVAAMIGGGLIAIPAPLWLGLPLIGLGAVFYVASAGLFGLFGMGVQHLWREVVDKSGAA